MRRIVELVALSLILVACATTPGNPGVGTLHGIVFDLDKTPVSGTLIILKKEGTAEQAQTTLTNSQGRFSFPEVKPGKYSIALSKTMYEDRSWPLELSDLMEVVYLQTSSYWQLLDAAADALGKQQWGEAEEYLNRAATIQRESSTALFLGAVLKEKRGDTAAAIVDIEKALKLDDKAAYLWRYIAELYEKANLGTDKVNAAFARYLALQDDAVVAEKIRKAN